jgi:hypothetical protein
MREKLLSFRAILFLLLQLHGEVILGLSLAGDLDIVSRQLGYRPTNFVRVSARNQEGTPIAIQTYPLDGGARRRQSKARRSIEKDFEWLGTPFPTLYWLVGPPELCKAIADMERQGFVGKIEDEVKQDGEILHRFRLAHEEYAGERWASLTKEDRGQLISLSAQSTTVQRMRHMLESSGIAGGNLTLAIPTIKCLHTHYAHFRSQATSPCSSSTNPVGARIHEILLEEYPDLTL